MASIILLIFRGGSKAYNQCSIRKIRNIFVHDVTEYVVKAIVGRNDERYGWVSKYDSMPVSLSERKFMKNKTKITRVVIPEGVTSIGDRAFCGCSSLTSVVIPEGVTSIGDGAFGLCESFTIYCAAEKQPEGWHYYWNPSDRPVVWGYKSKP